MGNIHESATQSKQLCNQKVVDKPPVEKHCDRAAEPSTEKMKIRKSTRWLQSCDMRSFPGHTCIGKQQHYPAEGHLQYAINISL